MMYVGHCDIKSKINIILIQAPFTPRTLRFANLLIVKLILCGFIYFRNPKSGIEKHKSAIMERMLYSMARLEYAIPSGSRPD